MIHDSAVTTVDALWRQFYLARSLFPRMSDDMADAGVVSWSPPGYYDESPYAAVVMKRAVAADDVAQNNAIAHWINENLIVRLYAVLQVFDVPKSDLPDAPGYDHYRVVRRLRDKIAHGSNRYNDKRDEDIEALERLTRVCPGFTQPERYGGRFDLSISEVLWPLVNGCRDYAATVLGMPLPLTALEPAPPGHEPVS
ncbi:MAG: hypothetical protein ACYCXZ_08870 [Coriobacteriia bacterium]